MGLWALGFSLYSLHCLLLTPIWAGFKYSLLLLLLSDVGDACLSKKGSVQLGFSLISKFVSSRLTIRLWLFFSSQTFQGLKLNNQRRQTFFFLFHHVPHSVCSTHHKYCHRNIHPNDVIAMETWLAFRVSYTESEKKVGWQQKQQVFSTFRAASKATLYAL